MDNQLLIIPYSALFGALYGVLGFASKRQKGEKINMKKLYRTVFLWGTAGAIVSSSQGVIPSERLVEQQVTAIGGLGVAFDMLWPKARRVVEGFFEVSNDAE